MAVACKELWGFFGHTIIEKLEAGFDGDVICRDIEFPSDLSLYSSFFSHLLASCASICDRKNQCKMGPVIPPHKQSVESLQWRAKHKSEADTIKGFLGPLSIVWPWDKVIDHLPAEDWDGDKYSGLLFSLSFPTFLVQTPYLSSLQLAMGVFRLCLDVSSFISSRVLPVYMY